MSVFDKWTGKLAEKAAKQGAAVAKAVAKRGARAALDAAKDAGKLVEEAIYGERDEPKSVAPEELKKQREAEVGERLRAAGRRVQERDERAAREREGKTRPRADSHAAHPPEGRTRPRDDRDG
jgi:hypothetical protein